MENNRYKYETPLVEVLEVQCESFCASQEGTYVQRFNYEEEEWQ